MKHSPSSSGDLALLVCRTETLWTLLIGSWTLAATHWRFVYATKNLIFFCPFFTHFLAVLVAAAQLLADREFCLDAEFVVWVKITESSVSAPSTVCRLHSQVGSLHLYSTKSLVRKTKLKWLSLQVKCFPPLRAFILWRCGSRREDILPVLNMMKLASRLFWIVNHLKPICFLFHIQL